MAATEDLCQDDIRLTNSLRIALELCGIEKCQMRYLEKPANVTQIPVTTVDFDISDIFAKFSCSYFKECDLVNKPIIGGETNRKFDLVCVFKPIVNGSKEVELPDFRDECFSRTGKLVTTALHIPSKLQNVMERHGIIQCHLFFLNSEAPIERFYMLENITTRICINLAECGLYFESRQKEETQFKQRAYSHSLRILCSLIRFVHPPSIKTKRIDWLQVMFGNGMKPLGNEAEEDGKENVEQNREKFIQARKEWYTDSE